LSPNAHEAQDLRSYKRSAIWKDLGADDQQAIRWLRENASVCDLVYVSTSGFGGYGIYGGLPQFHLDHNVESFRVLSSEQMAARSEAAASAGEFPDQVRWFVLRDSSPEERAVLIALQHDPAVVRTGKFGSVTVYHRTTSPGPVDATRCHRRK